MAGLYVDRCTVVMRVHEGDLSGLMINVRIAVMRQWSKSDYTFLDQINGGVSQ